jgi:hypothetical protein
MRIEVASSEILDKYSILEIKESHGLDVSVEKQKLQDSVYELFESHVLGFYYQVLKTINEQLWEIEDAKRDCERRKEFGDVFVDLSRSVYMINDERARIKKMIDLFSKSEINEVKSHGSYL